MTECKFIHKRYDRPTDINNQISIGNRITHESHSLSNFKGLVYCKRCGASGSQRLYKLASQCIPVNPQVQSHGQDALNNIKEGRLPRHIKVWPDDEVISMLGFFKRSL